MKVYTEEDLLKAIKFACALQKFRDYQTAGVLLILEHQEELPANINMLLDNLSDIDNNAHNEVLITEIFDESE